MYIYQSYYEKKIILCILNTMLFTACNNEDTPIQPKPKAIICYS